MIRTRFAPSPTGMVHLGGLRTALFNYCLARRQAGRFLLRIEDTDTKRSVPGAAEEIKRTLAWAGLAWDEEVWQQSTRLPVYQHHAQLLMDSGSAYRCFCSEERIQHVRAESALRGAGGYDRACLHIPPETSALRARNERFVVRMKDPDSQGPFEDAILLKSDAFPTYHLAHLIDDHLAGITDVMRGEEWLPSLHKHLALYRAFGWHPPRFFHLPLLVNPDGSKLSKRQGSAHVASYREAGYLPEAVLNYVALMGWSPHAQTESEVMTLHDMVGLFDAAHVSKGGAVVSRSKLDFFNRSHLRRKIEGDGIAELVEQVKPALGADNDEYIRQVLLLAKERLHNIPDIPSRCDYFFHDPHPALTEGEKEVLRHVQPLLAKCTWDARGIEASLVCVSQENEIGMGRILRTLRHAIAGNKTGPGMPHAMQLIGPERCLRRLHTAMA